MRGYWKLYMFQVLYIYIWVLFGYSSYLDLYIWLVCGLWGSRNKHYKDMCLKENLLTSPHSIVNTSENTCAFKLRIDKHTFLINHDSITGGLFLNIFLLTLQHNFANATQVSLWISNRHKLETWENKKKQHPHTLIKTCLVLQSWYPRVGPFVPLHRSHLSIPCTHLVYNTGPDRHGKSRSPPSTGSLGTNCRFSPTIGTGFRAVRNWTEEGGSWGAWNPGWAG